MNLCEYGCGQEAEYKFKNGKWCCSAKWQNCPAKKKQITKYLNSYKDKNKENEIKEDLKEDLKELKEDLKELNKINKSVKEEFEKSNESTNTNSCETCKNTNCTCNKENNKIKSTESNNEKLIHTHKVFDFTNPIKDETLVSDNYKVDNEFLNTQTEIFNNVVIPKSNPIKTIKKSKKQFFLTRLIKRIFKRK